MKAQHWDILNLPKKTIRNPRSTNDENDIFSFSNHFDTNDNGLSRRRHGLGILVWDQTSCDSVPFRY